MSCNRLRSPTGRSRKARRSRTAKVRSSASMREESTSLRTTARQLFRATQQEFGGSFMPALPVDARKFAGMSEEQARTFPRRTVVGTELSEAEAAALPKMISTDAHVMEPDALWHELTP